MRFDLIFIFILIELITVSYFDIKTRKIPNLWSLLNLFFAGLFLIGFGESFFVGLLHFKIPVLFLMVTFLLFWMKIMGGGDSKFLSTLLLMMPEPIQKKFLFLLIISTVLLGLFFLLMNAWKKRHIIKSDFMVGEFKQAYFKLGSKIPYAPVALGAWIFLGLDYFEVIKIL